MKLDRGPLQVLLLFLFKGGGGQILLGWIKGSAKK